MRDSTADVAIIGGGAAGLTAAIFVARQLPGRSVVILDGARKLGAKILVSGGGRCNVTNRAVTANDYCGGSRNSIRRVLKSLPADRTVEFFENLGVQFYVEEDTGKLFPTTDKARTVLEALVREAERHGVKIRCRHRVAAIERFGDDGAAFRIRVEGEEGEPAEIVARRVILAAGGQSFPKTGSDGSGFTLAASLGHTLVPCTPSLAPLLLDGDLHARVSGNAHEVELIVRAEGWKPIRVQGILLWTHFGVSGPAVLDGSRHWLRARLEGRSVSLEANLLPEETFESLDAQLIALAKEQPKLQVATGLGRMLTARLAAALLSELGIKADIPLGHLPKDARRKLVHALIAWPLPVRDSRGYAYAEATAGGVPLSEVNPQTMESRVCPGLFLAGEVLDVDGRIGGFNFQWAWSSGHVAAAGVSRSLGSAATT